MNLWPTQHNMPAGHLTVAVPLWQHLQARTTYIESQAMVQIRGEAQNGHLALDDDRASRLYDIAPTPAQQRSQQLYTFLHVWLGVHKSTGARTVDPMANPAGYLAASSRTQHLETTNSSAGALICVAYTLPVQCA